MIFEYKIEVVPVSTLELFLNRLCETGWQPFTISYVPPIGVAKTKIELANKENVAIVERALVGLKRLKKTAPEPKGS